MLSDVLVVWDVPRLRPHGPDIAVILGVREPKLWRPFDVAAEGARPALDHRADVTGDRRA